MALLVGGNDSGQKIGKINPMCYHATQGKQALLLRLIKIGNDYCSVIGKMIVVMVTVPSLTLDSLSIWQQIPSIQVVALLHRESRFKKFSDI